MSLWVFGGCRDKEKITDIMKIDIATKTVSTVPTSSTTADLESSSAMLSLHGCAVASLDEEKQEIFFLSQDGIWVYSLVNNEWDIMKSPLQTYSSYEFAAYDAHLQRHLIVKQGHISSIELKKPSKETVVSMCKYMIRKQKYQEMVYDDPISALTYLQNNISETVSSDSDQIDDFHKLASLVFSKDNNVRRESMEIDHEFAHQRSCLFNKLIDVLPEEHCQPRNKLSNFIH